jgi:uncharacterized protein
LQGLGSALVAFSGGADSALVLALAKEALGARAVALTGTSASLPAEELAAARAFAEKLGVRHEVIETRELADPDYARNPVDRCYYCKRTLYTQCAEVAQSLGLAHVVDGFNADDARDYRPGRRAAVEGAVVSPLAEAGLDKAMVRAAARALGLQVWDKPASPCLSSRLPYGTAVTPERLAQVGAAEAELRRLGFRELRVRHHGDVARVELTEEGLARLADSGLRAQVDAALKAVGYLFVAVDLEPFRSGRLNDVHVTLKLAGASPP